MRRASRIFSPLVLLPLVISGCGDEPVPLPDESVRISSGEVTVVVHLSPFELRVLDANGAEVIASLPGDGSTPYGGPGATVDTPAFLAQTLPGWDGYVAGEAAWRHATRATVASATGATASFVLEGADVSLALDLSVDGPRVHFHLATTGPVIDPALNKSTFAFRTTDDEHFYGLGERFATVDHRGQSLFSWAEEGGLGGGEDAALGPKNPFPNGPSMTYFPVPFLISSHGYGLHVETTYRSEMHFASERPDAWRVAVNAPAFAATLYVHADPLATLADYTADTGRPPVPAPWVFGVRRRVGVNAVVNGVEEWRLMRQRGIAVTGIDDAVHFLPALSQLGKEAELAAWTSTLHDAGYKALAYNNPYVAKDDANAAADYAHGIENGFFVKLPSGEPALTQFISGKLLTLATIDLTNPGAVTWFQDLLRRALDLGYDGWMHDFGEYIPRDAIAFDGRRGDELHNAFPVLSAKAAHDLMEAERPGDYLFFVRSGGAGTQQYVPAVWGGDAEATFDETLGLPSSVRGGLTLSMTGAPYWGSDMTGFKCITNEPHDKEIFLRWVEFGAVSPIMMEQNACANPINPQTKWSLWSDEETIEVYARYARLHTRMLPYFMVLANEAHASGRPLSMHPFLLHPTEPDAWTVDDAYYLGPSLYASPVVRRGRTNKETWLPPGRYVDLDDLAVYEGGARVTVDAPLGKLPLFLVEGQLLPLLDPSIDTLAPATDPTVVTPDDVADRLDVMVALAPGGHAAMTLADGTELEAARAADAGNPDALAEVAPDALPDCAACFHQAPEGGVDRLRANGALAADSDVTIGDVHLTARGGPARRVRWDVLRLP